MKSRTYRSLSKQGQQALNNEVLRQLEEAATKISLGYDSIVLLLLYKEFGFGKRKLRQFWDSYSKLETEMHDYFLTAPVNSMNGQLDLKYYAEEELKRIGVDVENWRNKRAEWKPSEDESWNRYLAQGRRPKGWMYDNK